MKKMLALLFVGIAFSVTARTQQRRRRAAKAGATSASRSVDQQQVIYLDKYPDYKSQKKALSAIIAQGGRVVVDFFATWCGPCRNLSGNIGKIAKLYPSISFVKVNVDSCDDLADDYNIKQIPDLYFYNKGKQIKRQLGYGSRSMLDFEQLLKDIFKL